MKNIVILLYKNMVFLPLIVLYGKLKWKYIVKI